MQITLRKPKKGQSEIERDMAVVDDRTYNCFDIGVYMRIVRALADDAWLDYYIDADDPDVRASIARLADGGAISVVEE